MIVVLLFVPICPVFMNLDDDDDREAAPGHIAQLAHGGDDSEDEFSGPTVGNSEGESVAMTDQQLKQARGAYHCNREDSK